MRGTWNHDQGTFASWIGITPNNGGTGVDAMNKQLNEEAGGFPYVAFSRRDGRATLVWLRDQGRQRTTIHTAGSAQGGLGLADFDGRWLVSSVLATTWTDSTATWAADLRGRAYTQITPRYGGTSSHGNAVVVSCPGPDKRSVSYVFTAAGLAPLSCSRDQT
ncbi:hypothetical protein ACFVFS_35660 [Kitasatospora sp. NPDC057692]|uniref:hypothetical protein n=1 Tax=Kitasatospora sp. NPDC057692 TaxID=3346215 RepID=UPI0036AB330D